MRKKARAFVTWATLRGEADRRLMWSQLLARCSEIKSLRRSPAGLINPVGNPRSELMCESRVRVSRKGVFVLAGLERRDGSHQLVGYFLVDLFEARLGTGFGFGAQLFELHGTAILHAHTAERMG